jgi:hypothetical protein
MVLIAEASIDTCNLIIVVSHMSDTFCHKQYPAVNCWLSDGGMINCTVEMPKDIKKSTCLSHQVLLA